MHNFANNYNFQSYQLYVYDLFIISYRKLLVQISNHWTALEIQPCLTSANTNVDALYHHKESTCILVFKSDLSENAKKRINILKNSNDGFNISEEDMKLRGYGDILGFKQSGIKKFKLADPILHKDLFELAEAEVKKIEINNYDLRGYYKLLKLYDRASIINDII